MRDFIEGVTIVVFIVLVIGGGAFGAAYLDERSDTTYCEQLAVSAEIDTKYFNDDCYVDACGAWVTEEDLPYHINRLITCSEEK